MNEKQTRKIEKIQQIELEALYNSAPVGLCVFDDQLRYVRINKRLAEINGIPVEEHIGRSLSEVVPDLAEQAGAIHRQIMETGEPVSDVEFTGTTASQPGVQRTWIEQWLPLKDEDGTVIGINVVAKEITARKEAEERLRESEEKYRALVQQSLEGLVVALGPPPKFVFANPSFAGLMGYTVREVLAMSPQQIYELVHPDDREMFFGRFADRIAGKEVPGHYEVRGITKDGRTIWLEVSSTRIDYLGGPAVQALFTDVTERKKSEVERDRLLGQLRAVTESMNDGLILAELDGRVIYLNPSSLALHGYSNLEEALRTWDETMSQWEVKDLSDIPLPERDWPMPRALRGERFNGYEVRIRRRDTGKEFVGSFSGGLVRDAVGEPIFALITVRDVTQRKMIEEELRKSREDLEIRVQERTAELQEMAEELRFLSARLLETQETERRSLALELHDELGGSLLGIKMAVEKKLSDIRKGKTARESTTLEEILDLVKGCMRDSNRLQHNLRPSVLDHLGIVPALRSLCREFDHAYKDIHTAFSLGIDEGGVPEELKIIVYRISQEALTNVAKHSGAEHVSLSLTNRQGKVQLLIQDDGRGFDVKSLRPEKFRRGIGLASMKERCELSGGSFFVRSKAGEGTTVRCIWPQGL
jgi:PAS domain S-box-containing protein